jgi:hypothetical protein
MAAIAVKLEMKIEILFVSFMLWWVVFINESPLHDLHWVLFDY